MVKLNAYTTWATGVGGLMWDWVLALTAGLALEMSELLWYDLTASWAGLTCGTFYLYLLLWGNRIQFLPR